MNSNLNRQLISLVSGLLFSITMIFSQGTIRIMPLGNSISYGNMCVNGNISGCQPISGSEAISYRYRLLNLMNDAGYSVNFIGSQNSGSNYLQDTDNAGFGGISDDKLADIMETGTSTHTGPITSGPYLETYPADIILLHIGTNDVLGADTSNVNGVERILDAIDSYENSSGNKIMVFLARIISYRGYVCNTQPRVKAYNSKIEQLAASRIAAGDQLKLVDMECAAYIDYSTDMIDEVHPNQAGYDKMGDLWFTELNTYLRSIYVEYSITPSASGSGTIEPSETVVLNEGQDQTFTFTPAQGFMIEDVFVDGTSVGPISEYSFTNLTSDHNISVSFIPITHEISALVEGNGSITPSGTVVVNEGDNQSFSIEPAANHKITDVNVNGSSMGAINSYEFINVSSDQSIKAIFEPITHTISASSGINGNIDPKGEIILNQGADITFIITPDEGFEIIDIKINNNSIEITDSYTFSNITADHNIEVSFIIKTYEITTGISGNGSINPGSTLTLDHGTAQTFSIEPDENHKISDVLINGQSVGVVSEYEFVNVTSNQSIEAFFEPIRHTITATSGDYGVIDPEGDIIVDQGADQVFNVTPYEGYEVEDVVVDGASMGALESYTFSNINTAHSIEAFFKIKTYQITTKTDGNGSFSPEGPVLVNHGSDQAFIITPDSGYKVKDILIDGISEGKISVYNFSKIIKDHSISALFELVTHSEDVKVFERANIIKSLYPNPTEGIFTIYFNRNLSYELQVLKLRIYDVSGKIVYSKQISMEEKIYEAKKKIDLKSLGIKEGIYFLEIRMAGKKEINQIFYLK